MTDNVRDFWTTSGWHLLDVTESGQLKAGPDYFRAFFARPEMQPEEDACVAELALHDALMRDPLMDVPAETIAALADEDARYNYELVLSFRDLVVEAGTLEAAYLKIVSGKVSVPVPPLFVDQLVHALLRQILAGVTDPIRLRAAELLFRTQTVSTDEGRIMLADDETVEMHAQTRGGSLGQLIAGADTPLRQVELNVLDENNADNYWSRTDRFDMVIDMRFTQPPLDAFCRVMEAWIGHFTGIRCAIQPLQKIEDDHWTWHIGLDAESTRILNALYNGEEMSGADMESIIALFRLDIRDQDSVIETVRGKPVYLALSRSPKGKLAMKPQNLLVNLPLEKSA